MKGSLIHMGWFNIFGLVFMLIIMIPNIVYAIKHKDGFQNTKINKALLIAEQVGRYGCFAFMAVNIPGTWFGWWSDEAFAVYLITDTALTVIYCVIWAVCFNKNTLFRALSLSVIPSVIFLFSGIMSRSVLLIASAVVFAPAHICICYKNSVCR